MWLCVYSDDNGVGFCFIQGGEGNSKSRSIKTIKFIVAHSQYDINVQQILDNRCQNITQCLANF